MESEVSYHHRLPTPLVWSLATLELVSVVFKVVSTIIAVKGNGWIQEL